MLQTKKNLTHFLNPPKKQSWGGGVLKFSPCCCFFAGGFFSELLLFPQKFFFIFKYRGGGGFCFVLFKKINFWEFPFFWEKFWEILIFRGSFFFGFPKKIFPSFVLIFSKISFALF
ncbi:MAG: hypothetical protein H0A75_06855 [Candidatus Methanofishera endochildressiae]|uniref:Uncharacterized protein n=1 Tax=Candidatus Methanofishera endochildressiae TaxID=2738884 RepID=A0A7Z0MP78_9GAMM|nr:hypothetical protein [Candidatus Methanofishera endochildressiae]